MAPTRVVRLKIPEEVLIGPTMEKRRDLCTDPDGWLTSDFEWIKGQCGSEYAHIPTDDLRHQISNMRRAGKLGRLTKGGHGASRKLPTPNWYLEYLESEHWRRTRLKFLKFWNYSCAICCTVAKDVHHRHYQTLGQEGVTDCVVLCRTCHNKFHGRINHIPAGDPRDA